MTQPSQTKTRNVDQGELAAEFAALRHAYRLTVKERDQLLSLLADLVVCHQYLGASAGCTDGGNLCSRYQKALRAIGK